MFTRRRLLQITASTVPASLLLGFGGAARAQQKTPQKVVKYQDKPKEGQKCSDCTFFTEPDSCRVVEGTISPEGWCTLFQLKGSG